MGTNTGCLPRLQHKALTVCDGVLCVLVDCQIQLVEFDATNNEVGVKRIFSHDGEVRSLVPSPHDAELLLTCGKTKGQPQEAKLWRMPSSDGEGEEQSDPVEANLAEVGAVPAQRAPVSQ